MKLSVIMPVYNDEKYVGKAIQSICNQTYKNWELFICDDGSTDISWSIIQGFAIKDKRIKIYKNDINQGKVKSVNFHLWRCSGEFITIHDADDWSEPNRFEEVVKFSSANEEFEIIGSSYNNFNEKGQFISTSKMNFTYSDIKNNIGVLNMLHGPTMFFKSGLPNKVDGFYRDIKMGEDIDFIWRVAERYPITNIPKALYNYRINPTSITKHYKHQLKLKIQDRKLIHFLHQQRKETGRDFLMSDDKEARRIFLVETDKDYKENYFTYFNEYVSYLLFYKLKKNAVKFMLYNMKEEGITFKKLKLLIYVILFK